MSERVTISVENHIADVRFNRPEKMNALDGEQIDAIVEAGEKLAAMEGVRAIVLSGAMARHSVPVSTWPVSLLLPLPLQMREATLP